MSPLAAKRVLLVGAGGLGSPVAMILARSGVGHFAVMDDDRVDASNLHRQLLYTAGSVGQLKAEVACARIEEEARRAGNLTSTVAREMRLTPDVDPQVLANFDLIVEGADNFASKFLVADAAAIARVPCVQAGAVRWVGWALGVLPGVTACLRCVFEDIPQGPTEGCAQAGVVGPVVGVVGALQAAIALRLLHGDATSAGVLHSYRGLTGSLRRNRMARRSTCPLCSGAIRDLNSERYMPRECAA